MALLNQHTKKPKKTSGTLGTAKLGLDTGTTGNSPASSVGTAPVGAPSPITPIPASPASNTGVSPGAFKSGALGDLTGPIITANRMQQDSPVDPKKKKKRVLGGENEFNSR